MARNRKNQKSQKMIGSVISGLIKQMDHFSKIMKATRDLCSARGFGMNLLSTHSNPYNGHKVPFLEEDLIEVDLMEEKVANKYW